MNRTRTPEVHTQSFRSRALRMLGVIAMLLIAANLSACKTQVSRGGDGTLNPGLDDAALSTGLDKMDLDYLVKQNLDALYDSGFWKNQVLTHTGDPILVTIFPIRNDTSEHIDDQMNTLLASIETSLVNSGIVGVVSRERQEEMIREVVSQHRADMNPSTAARVGQQLGAKYYITGKLGAVDERLEKARRVQYSLFIQMIDVETSLIRFQHQSERSKAIKR